MIDIHSFVFSHETRFYHSIVEKVLLISPNKYFSAMMVEAGPAQVAPKPACSITSNHYNFGLSAGAAITK